MNQVIKKELVLENLSCANCAAKIEREVNKLDGVKTANVNFVSQKLEIIAENEEKLETIIKQASKIAVKIEPDIEVLSADDTKEESENWLSKLPQICGAVIFIFSVVLTPMLNIPIWAKFACFFIAYLLVGGDVILRALRNISKGQVFDENFLMTIATVGAFFIGEFAEGVAVMLFYQVGEFFQDMAVDRSRKSITKLMDIRPDFANLLIDGVEKRVSPKAVMVGDKIVVKPGEKIPLDGQVVEGKSTLDTSALTGESMPRYVEAGSGVLSGSINKGGVLVVEVFKEFGESTISKILELVQNASSKKAPTENFITKFARYYTPFVVFSALLLAVIPPLFIKDANFYEWVKRSLVFLVVSCPCALVISIPLSFFGGIGGASKNGILVKGSNYLEALNDIDTVVFDKTGTLTKGEFSVVNIVNKDISKDEFLLYAAYAEGYSSHPIAISIQKAYEKELDKTAIKNYQEIFGLGVSAEINGKTVFAGNKKLMDAKRIKVDDVHETGTIIYLVIDNIYHGFIVIADEIKKDSKKTIQDLKMLGIKSFVMLTGDNKKVGESIAKDLGITKVHTGLLPQQKVEFLENIKKNKTKGKVAFVGDGINDAPVLARADIGVAMGAVGSDAAIEAADIVLMTDEPSKLATAVKIAKKTRNIVWQNIIFALSVKAIILIMATLGVATMWVAVFGDVGVALIAILNAMRVMSTKKYTG